MTTVLPPGAGPHTSEDASRRYLAAIVESCDDAIIGKTIDGIIRSWNRSAERIYGYTAEEAIGRPIAMLVPPDLEDDVCAILERLQRGERIEHYETIRMAKDGRRLNISLTISPILDDAGNVIGASTIARDVTAQVEARRALEQSRQELEHLTIELKRTIEELERQRTAAEAEAQRLRRLQRVSAALTAAFEPDQVVDVIVGEVIEATGAYAGGVVELSPDGRELVVIRTRGYDPAAVRPYLRLSTERPTPAWDAIRTGEAVFLHSQADWARRYPSVTTIHKGEGTWVALPLRARGRVIGALTLTFNGAREFSGADRDYMMALANQCAHALDRAHLYEAERLARQQAQEASRAKSNFLAVMSHELRTPLTAILGYGALLEDEVVGPLNEQQREHVARMRESGRHLLGLINQILSFSRIEAGRERVDVQRLDAVAILSDVAEMVSPLAARDGLRLEVEAPAEPVEMRSDPGKIRQILLNLASNAVKFTPEGEVRLRLFTEGDDVVFQVADTGPGIAAADRERIFRPFEQADWGPTRVKGGAGLGLSVSLELARLLGGGIDLDTEVGRGSTFTVRLPRVWRGAEA